MITARHAFVQNNRGYHDLELEELTRLWVVAALSNLPWPSD
jgi:hypothetical protein